MNEAISSYLRSGDSSRYKDVIARSQEANAHGDLVKYLLMVRKKVKESKVRARIVILCPAPHPVLQSAEKGQALPKSLVSSLGGSAELPSKPKHIAQWADLGKWSPSLCCSFNFTSVRLVTGALLLR